MKQLRDRLIFSRDSCYSAMRGKGVTTLMFQSPVHYIVCLEVVIAQLGNNPLCFESLVASLPRKLGSRSTVNNVVNDFLAKNIFKKSESNLDKRRKLYTLKDAEIREIENWVGQKYVSLREVG